MYKAQSTLHLLPNINLLLFPFVLLTDLLLISLNQLQLLDVEFLQENSVTMNEIINFKAIEQKKEFKTWISR